MDYNKILLVSNVQRIFIDISFCLLFIYLLFIASSNRKVTKLVRVLGCSNYTKVITQLLLLQVSLREVLDLSLGESYSIRSSDGELSAVTRDGDSCSSNCSSLSINLEAVLEVLLERSNIQNFIVHGGGTVDDELNGALLCLNLVFE